MKHGYKRYAKYLTERDPQLIGMLDTFDTVSVDNSDCTDPWPWPRLYYILDSLKPGDEVYVQSLDKIASSIDDVERIARVLIDAKASIVIVGGGQRISGENIGILNALDTIKKLQSSIAEEIRLSTKPGPPPMLTETQAEEIRKRAKAGEMVSKLAKEFGVSRAILYRKYGVIRTPKAANH